MALDEKSSDEILKELFNSIHDIVPSSDDDGDDGNKKVIVKKEKKSKKSYDTSYSSKSKHKKKKKSKKSSTKYSLCIKGEKKSKDKESGSKISSDSKKKLSKSKIKVEKNLDLIEVLKKEVIDSVPSTVIPVLESISVPPLSQNDTVSIKKEPTSPKRQPEKESVVEDSVKPVDTNEDVAAKHANNEDEQLSISKVANVFQEDCLDEGDKLPTKRFGILDKVKKTIQIQNLSNSSILEDAAKSRAISEELKKKKTEEGELTDDLSDITSSADSEPDSTDDDAKESKSSNPHRLSKDSLKDCPEQIEKGKKKKKSEKHRHKDRTKRKEHKAKRSGDERKGRSRSRSRIGSALSNRRSSSRHDFGKHHERRWGGSRSRSRSSNRGHRRSHSPRSKRRRSQSPWSKRRRSSRESDDLRSKLRRDRSDDRRHRSRGRQDSSRTRQEKDEYFIDKQKLLEIARKNALTMLRQGQVAGDVNKVVQHIQQTAAAAGKSVDELTDFCKHLSRKEASGMESVSSESSSDESEKPFHHPFKLKERPGQIIMNIRNCVPLTPKTHQEKATEVLRVQFPVSSGQLHRKTESEWIPVSPKRTETSTTVAVTSKPKAPLAIEPPPVAPKYPTMYPEKRPVDIGAVISERLAAIRKDYDTSSSSIFGPSNSWETSQTTGLFTGSTGARVLTPMELASGQQAWARKSHQPLKSERLLVENECTPPMMASKMNNLPSTAHAQGVSGNERYGFSLKLPDLNAGQLVCVTDLKVKGKVLEKLFDSQSYLIETNAGRKIDQLISATPVSGGMGMSMLQKMGWKPGEGLGKHHEGTLEPLKLPVKMDKKGNLEARVYKNKPRTLDELKEAIRVEVSQVERAMLERVYTNLQEHILHCITDFGNHMTDVIFHT